VCSLYTRLLYINKEIDRGTFCIAKPAESANPSPSSLFCTPSWLFAEVVYPKIAEGIDRRKNKPHSLSIRRGWTSLCSHFT
jgi:hypothetical protein